MKIREGFVKARQILVQRLDRVRIEDVAFTAECGPFDLLSGAVFDAPGETWGAINSSLQRAQRRLPGGSSIPELRP